MRHHKNITELPCDPGLGCTFPNCNCMPVMETSEVQEKKQVPIGVTDYAVFFSGAIIVVVCCLLALAVYYMRDIDNIVIFWLIFSIVLVPAGLFGFSRIKKMSKP